MKLHTTSSSPNGRRVAIFLAEKGIEVPLVEVDLRGAENLSNAFRARNPFGRVPVLELDDGTHIAESVAISRYFECTQPNPPLFGSTALEQANVEMWNRRAELNFLMPVAQAFRNITGIFRDREPVVPEWGKVAERAAADALPLFDACLKHRAAISPAIASASPTSRSRRAMRSHGRRSGTCRSTCLTSPDGSPMCRGGRAMARRCLSFAGAGAAP
jgi:glutathione S-transferase